jgi:uncharacterized protein
MGTIDKHAPGEFCWVELGTTDAQAGVAFYSKLLDWTVREIPAGPGMTYYIFLSDGNDAGAAYQLMKEQTAKGVPPHWLSYVAVTDAAAAAAKAQELGGKLLMAPWEVGEEGKLAVLEDPQGAAFAVWQAKKHIGVRADGLHYRACWNELATTDTEAAKKFYAALFGWSTHTQPMGGMDYTTWLNAGKPNGGMLQMTAEWAGIPPHWMVYFSVPDCNESAEFATELGAEVKVAPFDIPGVGRMCVVSDPQGAVCSLIQLEAMAA